MSQAPAAALPLARERAGGYNPDHFAMLDAAEDRHFWFRARSRVIGALAARLTGRLPAGFRVLELGCGNGTLLRTLADACPRGRVMGMDLFIEGLSRARRRTSCPLVQGDLYHPPFDCECHLVGLFDVLEHLNNDVGVLRAINRMMAPGAALMITVPAHMTLWSYFDEAARHCRRYSQSELSQCLVEAGFVVEYLTQFMSALFPLMWTARRLAALKQKMATNARSRNIDEMARAELRIVPGVNGLLTWGLSLEPRLIARGIRLPIGTSLLAVGRKAR